MDQDGVRIRPRSSSLNMCTFAVTPRNRGGPICAAERGPKPTWHTMAYGSERDDVTEDENAADDKEIKLDLLAPQEEPKKAKRCYLRRSPLSRGPNGDV